jgi:hypothetical protein
MKQMKETTPTITSQLTNKDLEIQWSQKGQPAIATWTLYVGTKANTKHPEGGFQWEIFSASVNKDTQKSIPLAHLPKGRVIYMQVGGITADEVEIYSDIISTSVPRESEKKAGEHTTLKTVVERFKKRAPEAPMAHDRH